MVGFVNLVFLCKPFTKWRLGVIGIVVAGIAVVGTAGILVGDLFLLKPAADNLLFLFGMLGIGISLALLLQLFRDKMENAVFALADKLEAKTKAKRVKK